MSYICPFCLQAEEPRWKRKRIQGDETYMVPSCPICEEEMEEADLCPLCESPKRKTQPMCMDCLLQLIKSLKWAADAVAVKGTSNLTEWEAISDVSQIMIERCELMERRKK